MFNRILIALDGSGLSESVIPYVKAFTKTESSFMGDASKIIVAYVVNPDEARPGEERLTHTPDGEELGI